MATSTHNEEHLVNLSIPERFWSLNYDAFLQRGYKLRERFRDGAIAEVVRRAENAESSEVADALIKDAIDVTGILGIVDDYSLVWKGMDATRTSDGSQVWIKRCALRDVENPETSPELALNLLLASQQSDENHCLPMLDYFTDHTDAALEFMRGSRCIFLVFPWGMNAYEHPWRLAAEAIEFVRQLIEGLVFLHDQGIAHRDIHAGNILMDVRSIFPHGIDTRRAFMGWTNFEDPSLCLDRIEVPVRYHYIDFEFATRFDSEDHTVTWRAGMHALPEVFGTTLPTRDELRNAPNVRYDAFSGDIWQLGMTLHLMFGKSIPSLNPLLRAMTDRRPKNRPTARACLLQFHTLTDELSRWELLWPVLDASPWRRGQGAERVLELDCLHFRDWARLVVKALRLGLCKPEQMKHLPQSLASRGDDSKP